MLLILWGTIDIAIDIVDIIDTIDPTTDIIDIIDTIDIAIGLLIFYWYYY